MKPHSLGPLYRRWAGLLAVCAGLAGLSGCSALDSLNAVTVQHSASVETGVPYGTEARQMLDIYRPAIAAPAGGWPVVVFFYGGTWTTGERADYRFLGEALASRGVLALVADYRLYPEVRYPDFLADSARALAYGLEHAQALGGNARRVFVMGHSAGGYNAAMLALDARWLRATGHAPTELAGWIGLAGPYDFLPTDNADAQKVFHHPDYPPQAQPIEFAQAGAPRTFLGAPENDRVVSFERSTQQMADRLRAAGVDVTLRPYARASHISLMGAFAWPLRPIAPVLDDVDAFIRATPARP
ncbi:MAG: alpha/beta hydrolase [Comamonadaceae bacterium]|nr:MAG: alpha/beta hydrolase [Comamonadaceae bacterium]